MKLERVIEEGQVYFNIVGTDIRIQMDKTSPKEIYCANFDNCLPDEEDLYSCRHNYLGEFTNRFNAVYNEIVHYMEWFIGFSRNISELDEVRNSYILALDCKV